MAAHNQSILHTHRPSLSSGSRLLAGEHRSGRVEDRLIASASKTARKTQKIREYLSCSFKPQTNQRRPSSLKPRGVVALGIRTSTSSELFSPVRKNNQRDIRLLQTLRSQGSIRVSHSMRQTPEAYSPDSRFVDKKVKQRRNVNSEVRRVQTETKLASKLVPLNAIQETSASTLLGEKIHEIHYQSPEPIMPPSQSNQDHRRSHSQFSFRLLKTHTR